MKTTNLSPERKWLILAGFLISGGGQGVLINTLSAFVRPVTENLGFSRGAFTLCTSLTFLISILSLPLYGELYRKKWFSAYMVLGAVVAAAVPLGFSFCKTLNAFYLFSVILGIVFNTISVTAVGNVLTRWFGRNRGLATGISFSGSGIMAAIVLRVVNSVIQEESWASGYRTVALSSFLLLLVGTIIVRIIETRHAIDPNDPELRTEYSGNAENESTTLRQAWKRFGFWGIILCGIITSFIAQSGGTSIMAYCADIGYDSAFQSRVASFSMLWLAAGKIIVGRMLDKKGLATGYTVTVTTLAGYAAALLLLPKTEWAGILYVLFYGISASMSTVLTSYAVSEAFGKKEYSRIYALACVGVNMGVMIGNVVPGVIYDGVGDYRPSWWLSLALSVILGFILTATCRDIKKARARANIRTDASA